MKQHLPLVLLSILLPLGALGQTEALPPPVLEPKAGFYDRPVRVEIFAEGRAVYYTTDGSRPHPGRSPRYEGPIPLNRTTVLRVLVRRGGEAHESAHTYFIGEPATRFPVVSIAIEPSILFHPEYGLFMKGSRAVDSLWKLPGANFWSRSEVEAHTEIFETGGRRVFASGTGLRLFGGMSRLFPQKSLALVARKRYGKKRFDHPIFGKAGPKKFKFLVLRNSGSDFGRTHFRDALMTSLVDGWNLDKQAYRPAHVYINGRYWGLYNIREKINRYFIADHHDVDKDSIDLIEHRMSLKKGSTWHYRRLLQFLEEHDLSQEAAFAWVESQMDVDNFMDYQIAQIYFDNRDAGGNIKFWRPQKPDGKWRWVLFDTDWGFGLHYPEAWTFNSLAFHTEPDGPSWPNPPWSTFILRKLLENEGFRHRFVNRFLDRLNTSLDPARVEARIDSFYRMLRPEIPRHFERWNLDPQTWETHVRICREFARRRPEYVRMHLMERFHTGAQRTLALETTPGGQILLNHTLPIQGSFQGVYFENYPVHLEAVPQLGYRFSHWEGLPLNPGEKSLTLRLSQNHTRLKAVFEPHRHPLADRILFNEIAPNNRLAGDWLEIYNATEEAVHLRGWLLTDLRNTFTFPDVTLPPKEYLVLCEDSAAFLKHFPYAYNVVGGLSFGINKVEERLQLFSSDGAVVDQFHYRLPPTDSLFTLNLLLPWLDNSSLENWEVRMDAGTPCFANPFYVQSVIQAQRTLWTQVGISAAVALICITLLALRLKAKRQAKGRKLHALGMEDWRN